MLSIRTTLLSVAGAILTAPVLATDLSAAEAKDDFLIGASVVTGTSHVGSGGRHTDFKPLWAFQLGPLRVSRSRASSLMSVGREPLETGLSAEFKTLDDISLSASLRLDNGRSFDSDPTLRGLPDIGTTLRVRVGARQSLGPNWGWSLSMDHDLLGREGGLRLGTGVNYLLPVTPDTKWDFSLSGGFGNARYLQTHYGISRSAAEATGRAPYHLSGGFESLRLGANFSTALSDSWVAFGGLELSRMLGPASRSPLVSRLGTYSATLGLAYRSR